MKLESLATRLENMMTEKIKPLETNFEKMEKEMKELKDYYNFSLDHVEETVHGEIAETWE